MTETNAIVESEHVPEVPQFSERIIQWIDRGGEAAAIHDPETEALCKRDGDRYRVIRVLPDKPVERRVSIDWEAIGKDARVGSITDEEYQAWVEKHASVVETADDKPVECMSPDVAELVSNIKAKCQQYWNEHDIPDAEVHAALAFIYSQAAHIVEVPK